jgi:hypothetical protein
MIPVTRQSRRPGSHDTRQCSDLDRLKDVAKYAPAYRIEVTASSMIAMSGYSTLANDAKIMISLAIAAVSDNITLGKGIHRALDTARSVVIV